MCRLTLELQLMVLHLVMEHGLLVDTEPTQSRIQHERHLQQIVGSSFH